MPIRIYNTLSRQVEEFIPRERKEVRMFVCGPTVFDRIHIGNARTFTVFDVVAKYLRYCGYDVTYIQNITDIDDKIILRAGQQNKDPLEYAHAYDEYFRSDIRRLRVTAVSRYARAADHIPEIIRQIKVLLDKGYAYELADGIYYDLSKFNDYGKLSGRTTLQADDAVSRIDENREKRNSGDFALWKRSKPGEPVWESPWGLGRPGWHIEDTAITEHFFGPQYDLHGGARDLIFPHHEAEVAQQEAASGKVPFVKYWMHVGFLENKAQKMSKSLGNFATAHQLLETHAPEALRFFLLSAHYRSPLDFTDTSLAQAEAGVARIGEFIERLKLFEDKQLASPEVDEKVIAEAKTFEQDIVAALDDDFNTPRAIGVLFDFIRAMNQQLDVGHIDRDSVRRLIEVFDIADHVLGIIPHRTTKLPDEVADLVAERQQAKEAKDFAKADQLRNQIADLGYTIDDTPYGPLTKKNK